MHRGIFWVVQSLNLGLVCRGRNGPDSRGYSVLGQIIPPGMKWASPKYTPLAQIIPPWGYNLG